MIVNATNTTYVIVELTKTDALNILEGADIIVQSRAAQDIPVLCRVYCANPFSPGYIERTEPDEV